MVRTADDSDGTAEGPRADWTPAGRTSNTEYFHAQPDILVVMPEPGLKDAGASARENVAFQVQFAHQLGRRCGVVVHMTRLLSQDAEARRTYADGMDPGLFFAAALVATNPISRAIASFFLGLSRPRFPTQVFGSFEDAMAWVRSQRASGDTA